MQTNSLPNTLIYFANAIDFIHNDAGKSIEVRKGVSDYDEGIEINQLWEAPQEGLGTAVTSVIIFDRKRQITNEITFTDD